MFPFSNTITNLATTHNILRHRHHSTDDVPKNKMCENEIAKDKCALCGAEIPIGETRCACGGRGVDALKKSRVKSNKCSVCGIGLNVIECWMDEGVIYCEECYDKHMKDTNTETCVICGKSFHSKRKYGEPCFCENCSKMDWREMIRTNLSRPSPMCEKLNQHENHRSEQSAKADADKPILSLVPTQIIYEIEKVRAFGSKKYKDPDNWKSVEMERYHQALLRHTLAIWDDVGAKDKESGLMHLSHIATNIAFILELMNDGDKDES